MRCEDIWKGRSEASTTRRPVVPYYMGFQSAEFLIGCTTKTVYAL
jgi:hypothetical protein